MLHCTFDYSTSCREMIHCNSFSSFWVISSQVSPFPLLVPPPARTFSRFPLYRLEITKLTQRHSRIQTVKIEFLCSSLKVQILLTLLSSSLSRSSLIAPFPRLMFLTRTLDSSTLKMISSDSKLQ